jgi:hypothetical protein
VEVPGKDPIIALSRLSDGVCLLLKLIVEGEGRCSPQKPSKPSKNPSHPKPPKPPNLLHCVTDYTHSKYDACNTAQKPQKIVSNNSHSQNHSLVFTANDMKQLPWRYVERYYYAWMILCACQ